MSTELTTFYGDENVGSPEQPVTITRVATREGIGYQFATKDGWVTISLTEITSRIALWGCRPGCPY